MTTNDLAPYTVYDVDDPRSVVNLMLSKKTKEAILAIPEDLRGFSEHELEKSLKPNSTDQRLRITFWYEYDKAQSTGESMQLNRIVGGVCTSEYWERHVLVKPKKLAYITTPPVDYVVSMKAMLAKSMNEIDEILSLPNLDTKGKPNKTVIEAKIKLMQYLDAKVKGAIIQRMAVHEKRDIRISKEDEGFDSMEEFGPEDLDKINSRIDNVKKMIKKNDDNSEEIKPPKPTPSIYDPKIVSEEKA